ncbi:MAG: TetR/AcrR family transcriptional regulator [Chloroflexota bacterium]|nr:TetR/AcrR family transcriptional regulator [Chloroflexota bacterium]
MVRERLQRSALELFAEHGYDQTTASEIAAHAGVTERTFFRHFPDKREVLFASEAELRTLTANAILKAPTDLDTMPVLRCAFHLVVPLIERNRALAAIQAPIIRAAPALREREHAKAAALVDLVAESLQTRGVDQSTALLCARVGMDTFSVAIRRWSANPSSGLHNEVDAAFQEIRTLTSALANHEETP